MLSEYDIVYITSVIFLKLFKMKGSGVPEKETCNMLETAFCKAGFCAKED